MGEGYDAEAKMLTTFEGVQVPETDDALTLLSRLASSRLIALVATVHPIR